MLAHIARRALPAIPTLWLFTTLTFLLLYWEPGGPFDAEKPLSAELDAQIAEHYAPKLPLPHPYPRFMPNLQNGALGPPYQ